jgi:CRP-like cAMP-binding protein
MFSAVEAVIHRIVDASEETDFVILDFKRVTHIEQSATVLFLDLFRSFQERGKQIVFVHAQDHSKFVRSLEEGLAAEEKGWTLRTFPDLDGGLEWCEGQILARQDPGSSHPKPIALAGHDVCKGLDPEALACLERFLERRRFDPGEVIIRRGEPAREFYLLMNGQVRVTLDLPNGQIMRLTTRSPGMTFGELAIVDRASTRTADVLADNAVDCYALTIDAFDELGKVRPDIKMTLLENLLRNVAQMVARMSQEAAMLSC